MITDNRDIDKLAKFDNVCCGGKLIMTYGLPRSGKSTWARSTGFPIVNPDAIRLAKTGQRWWGPIEHEVWATARTMVRALFLAGHKTVILDSTAYSREQRDTFIPSGDVLWTRHLKIISTPVEICKERAISDGMFDLLDVIDWMDANWDLIAPDEDIRWPGVANSG